MKIVSKFPLGKVVITTNASSQLNEDDIFKALNRHAQGDWGDVCKEDSIENDVSLREGYRILSSYRDTNEIKFWIITEHDRSVTTVLLPEDY